MDNRVNGPYQHTVTRRPLNIKAEDFTATCRKGENASPQAVAVLWVATPRYRLLVITPFLFTNLDVDFPKSFEIADERDFGHLQNRGGHSGAAAGVTEGFEIWRITNREVRLYGLKERDCWNHWLALCITNASTR